MAIVIKQRISPYIVGTYKCESDYNNNLNVRQNINTITRSENEHATIKIVTC